jgi:hypothetical protein
MIALWIVCGIVGLIVLILIIGAFQSAEFKVQRSATMDAPASAVFSQVNDFHKWVGWSPWEKLDPNLEKTFEGPESGAGSMYSWKGNKKVGRGKMTMLEATPSSRIKIQLDFFEPFAASNIAEFNFAENAGKTDVTWKMTGKKNYMMKVMCMFMNMDKLVGSDFEKGLAGMKGIVEAK